MPSPRRTKRHPRPADPDLASLFEEHASIRQEQQDRAQALAHYIDRMIDRLVDSDDINDW